MKQRIVVGIDGSEGAHEAFEWAVDEARRRDAVLEVVHVWTPPYIEGYPFVGSVVTAEEIEAASRDTLAKTVAPYEATVEIQCHVVSGSPASALVAQARDADLLVVGSRGRGGFAGLLLGSVSQQVSHHAPCPVVIVPPSRTNAAS